ncbi:MAG: NAD-dependent epimerase/dehydratase family protein [Candidatus Velthaea sp.]
MNADAFYAGRRVVVLGASGFIGTHLVLHLRTLGAHVVAFARGRASAMVPALQGVEIVAGDVRSREDCARAVRAGDIVFHLAARSGAAASLAAPAENLDVNAGGMLALLEVARRLEPRPRIVFAGSRLEYGVARTLPVDESHPLEPICPYGIHKKLCEEYLALYARRYGIGYAVARLTNPYGSGAAHPALPYNVIGTMVVRGLAGEALTVFGDGKQLRDYVYIDDAVEAIALLGAASGNHVVNVGSGSGIAFADAVRTIAGQTGGAVVSVPWPSAEEAVETGDFVADIGRAGTLGYRPRTSFADGVAKTLAALA